MSTFLGQTSGMAAGTLASRLTGVLRDIALVAAIGTGIFSDTYSVANSIPNIIYILIAGGAINSVFIPALIRHMEDDVDDGLYFLTFLLEKNFSLQNEKRSGVKYFVSNDPLRRT